MIATASRTYAITSSYWTFRDSEEDARLARLRFHIEKEDYFPFLATIFGLAKEALQERGADATELGKKQLDFLSDTQKDLIYVHEHYDLSPKDVPLSFTKKKVIH